MGCFFCICPFFGQRRCTTQLFFCTCRSVLCIRIYKQIYTNNICRRWECVSCGGFGPPHRSASNLYTRKVTRMFLWRKKNKQTKKKVIITIVITRYDQLVTIVRCIWLDGLSDSVLLVIPWHRRMFPSLGFRRMSLTRTTSSATFSAIIMIITWIIILITTIIIACGSAGCHMEDCPCESVQKTSGRGKWCL